MEPANHKKIDRNLALGLSAAQMCTGALLWMSNARAVTNVGSALMTSGLGSAVYTLSENPNELRYDNYFEKSAHGAISSFVTGYLANATSLGWWNDKAGKAALIGYRVLGAMGGSILSTTVSHVVAKQELPRKRDVMKNAVVDGAGCFSGSVINSFSTRVLTGTGVINRFAQGVLQGSLGSASSQLVINMIDQKNPWYHHLFQSWAIGAGISGGLAVAEQIKMNALEKILVLLWVKKEEKYTWIKNNLNDQELEALWGTSPEAKRLLEFVKSGIARFPTQDVGYNNISFQKMRIALQYYEEAQGYGKVLDAWVHNALSINGQFVGMRENIAVATLDNTDLAEILASPARPEFVDCGWEELVQHIVLVHAFSHDDQMFANFKPEQIARIDYSRMGTDPHYQALFCLKEAITPDGTIGTHRDFDRIEFNGELLRRPTEHWAWCQLVQPHSVASWESLEMAVLEPASAFENTSNHKLYGVAPYDTLTIGAHKLSKNSILLVPEPLINELKDYLSGFEGKIVPFEKGRSLRKVVIESILKYYPETWHICDENGELLGDKARKTNAGFNQRTYIKKTDGQIICLIENEGRTPQQQISKSFQEISNRKHIGLHCNSITYVIENEGNEYFSKLTEFTKDMSEVKNSHFFAGKISTANDLNNLGILEACKLYQKLLSQHDDSDTKRLADYVINEGMYADLVSLFYKESPDRVFDLKPLELIIIFKNSRAYLINLLENLSKHQSFEFFEMYRTLLIQHLANFKKAKSEISNLDQATEIHQTNKKPLCLEIGETEWNKVKIPEQLNFDFGEFWPVNSQLGNFVKVVNRTLPKDIKKLQDVYHQVNRQQVESASGQYRKNVVSSLIKWALLELLYQSFSNEDAESLFAGKLMQQAGNFSHFGLEREDHTKFVGDCLFDNVCAQMENLKTSKELRAELVAFMRNRGAEYRSKPDYNEKLLVASGEKQLSCDNWDDYLEKLSQPQVWASELEISVLAEMLNCPLILFTQEFAFNIYNEKGVEPPIFLLHEGKNHFVSLMPHKGLDPKEIFAIIRNRSQER